MTSWELAQATDRLRHQLDQLVAARRLTESQARELLPGYEYPELFLWVGPRPDEVSPPPVESVTAQADRLQSWTRIEEAADDRRQWWRDQQADRGAGPGGHFDRATQPGPAPHSTDHTDHADHAADHDGDGYGT